VPSQALPPGPEYRAQRRAAGRPRRRRNLENWRDNIPWLLAMLPALRIAEGGQPDAWHGVLALTQPRSPCFSG